MVGDPFCCPKENSPLTCAGGPINRAHLPIVLEPWYHAGYRQANLRHFRFLVHCQVFSSGKKNTG
jgi:hypothetical protein